MVISLGGIPKMLILCNFLRILTVSDIMIHRAFRTHTSLYAKPIKDIFHFHYLPKLGQKKKMLCCPHPTKIKKLGRSVRIFFFFFFLRTVRELSFPIFFLKFLNGENSGGMKSKRIYKSCKCFLKPLNTNFSKFFAQIWHKKKKNKKKKPDPVFSHFTVGRERAT